MIKNGRPYTNENGWEDKELITDKDKRTQKRVFDWIKKNLIPRKTINFDHSSYGIKHFLEDDTGIYLTNNAFKDAMWLTGFSPFDSNELNWHYGVSKKSPAFMAKR